MSMEKFEEKMCMFQNVFRNLNNNTDDELGTMTNISMNASHKLKDPFRETFANESQTVTQPFNDTLKSLSFQTRRKIRGRVKGLHAGQPMFRQKKLNCCLN